MKYQINYYYDGGHSPSFRIIEAKDEKEALAKLQGVYGHNPRYEVTSVICQTDSGPSAQFHNQESASEAAHKLTAYKARQTLKEQKPMWFCTLDSEKIEGPIVLASIESKIDKGILKEDSLVMKTGKDWMTVSEFKKMSIPLVTATPSPSFTQTPNTQSPPVPIPGFSHRSTQPPYGNKDHKTSTITDTVVTVIAVIVGVVLGKIFGFIGFGSAAVGWFVYDRTKDRLGRFTAVLAGTVSGVAIYGFVIFAVLSLI